MKSIRYHYVGIRAVLTIIVLFYIQFSNAQLFPFHRVLSGEDGKKFGPIAPVKQSPQQSPPNTAQAPTTVQAPVSSSVQSSEEILKAKEEPCLTPLSDPLLNQQTSNLQEISQASIKNALGPALDLNICIPADGQDRLVERKILPRMREHIKNKKIPAVKKDDGTLATTEDWLRVDLVARLLVGEIATSPRCGLANVKAVAKVVLNRADFVKQKGYPAASIFVDKNGPQDIVTNVITKKFQFSSMNGNDAANKWVGCPANQLVKEYNMNGKKFSTGMSANILWTDALAVATEMVFEEKKFRKETSQITSHYFSVGEHVHNSLKKQGYRKRSPAVDGKVIDNIKCVEIWDPPKK